MKTRRTKIVCTIGPASSSAVTLRQLTEAGMNVARLNFSHGTHEEHARVIAELKALSKQLGTRVPILQDLSGPKMRIGKLEKKRIELKPNSRFALTNRNVTGDQTTVSINYPELVEALRPGDRVLLADGELELLVISTTQTEINCEVVVGGELRSNQGINAPGVSLKKPVPTQKDIQDLVFGIGQGVDWVAQSFVRSADEIRNLRSAVQQKGANAAIMAKLERQEALDDLDRILEVADGVMIARGDLGLEIPIQQVPMVQKDIIKKANLAGKPVITATQMLESMMLNPRPTRAEVADVANAIFDGTDAVMLSGETAAGKYPVAATKIMAQVAAASEEKIDYVEKFKAKPIKLGDDIEDAIAHAACHTALQIGAGVIICCTRSGQTARLVAKYRPDATIAVASPYEDTLQKTVLLWGTYPLQISIAENTDSMIAESKKAALKSGLARSGDRVVIVAGIPVDAPGTTNMIKADRF
ncbi:MAG: pyruvate kinase [candidate division Zixibacteria bacterium]|nr:pyruvate kinase [candidate division Zixibacteria bacterium]